VSFWASLCWLNMLFFPKWACISTYGYIYMLLCSAKTNLMVLFYFCQGYQVCEVKHHISMWRGTFPIEQLSVGHFSSVKLLTFRKGSSSVSHSIAKVIAGNCLLSNSLLDNTSFLLVIRQMSSTVEFVQGWFWNFL
jgi:hypothetical protein